MNPKIEKRLLEDAKQLHFVKQVCERVTEIANIIHNEEYLLAPLEVEIMGMKYILHSLLPMPEREYMVQAKLIDVDAVIVTFPMSFFFAQKVLADLEIVLKALKESQKGEV